MEKKMDARQPIVDLQQLKSALTFDRYNLHVVGEKILPYIQLAENLITTPLSLNNYKFLCKQVGIYYLFYSRNQELAEKYLGKYKELSEKNTFEYAEACSLIGHAGTIDGGYHDTS